VHSFPGEQGGRDRSDVVNVPPNKRKIFEVLLERYAEGMGMTGPVEFLPS